MKKFLVKFRSGNGYPEEIVFIAEDWHVNEQIIYFKMADQVIKAFSIYNFISFEVKNET